LQAVSELIDSSLVVRQDRAGEPRVGMLETVREYARELLGEHRELEDVSRAHAEYYRQLAELAEPELVGTRQTAWVTRLDDEHDNLRAALRWARDRGDAGFG